MTTSSTAPSAASLLAALDEHQRAAAAAPGDVPLAVLAGPGAGKTATVVARVAHLVDTGADPSSLLAITHTTRAAGELADRLSAAGIRGPHTSTFHAAALAHLRTLGPGHGAEVRELAGDPWPLVRTAANAVLGRPTSAEITEICSEIDWARGRLVGPDGYTAAARAAHREVSVGPEAIVEVWHRLEEHKAAAGLWDFGDVVDAAADLFCAHPHLSERWSHIVVDEYQDLDWAQHRLLHAWLAGRGCITAVGDPEQSIFAFRGSDPALLVGFTDHFPGARSVHLVANHRSSRQITAWVNALTVTPRPPLQARFDGAAPQVRSYDHERDEERDLARQLLEWHRAGTPFAAMTVLYRYNAAAARLEQALAAASVPYHVAGAQRFFDRPEVRQVLVPFGREARTSPDEAGTALLERCARDAGFDPDAPPAGMGAARQRWESVAALVELCRAHHGADRAGGLLAALLHRAREQHDPSPGGVTLATVHAAKGLEWDCVWVAGCVEGQFPSSFASTPEQLDQEQHAFYVAVSRARHHLVVSHAARRHNNWRSTPSRYLDLLAARSPRQRPSRSSGSGSSRGSSATGAAAVERPRPASSMCTRCGEPLRGLAARTVQRCSPGCLDGEPAAHHDRLVAWRDELATRLGERPSALATDRALFTIAATGRATDVAGLSPAAGTPPD